MATKSRACFCVSSFFTFLGLILIIVSFGIVAKIAYEKIDAEYQSTAGVSRQGRQQGYPQNNQPNYNQPNYNQPNYNQPNYNQPNYNQPNYNQPNNYGQQNNQQSGRQTYFPKQLQSITSVIDSNSANTWIVLVVIMAVGILVTIAGLICGNMAICCCPSGSSKSGRRGSGPVHPMDDKEWSDN